MARSSGDRFERLLSTVLTACAVVIAASVAYRAMRPQRQVAASRNPTFVADWRKLKALGHPLGEATSASNADLLVIADLECPACRIFHSTVRDVLRERPDLTVHYIAFPLTIHAHAAVAARLAECAAQVGGLMGWVEAVYAKQDSLGRKSWGTFALDAGLADTSSIVECANSDGTTWRVDSSRALAERIGLTGTPTVLINGWRLANVPPKRELLAIIDSVVARTGSFRSPN